MLKIIISSALLSLSTTICFAQLKIEINEKGHRKIILQGKFDKDNWMIESSFDFKNWKKLRLIKNNSIIDSRDSVEVLLEQHTSKHGGFGIRTSAGVWECTPGSFEYTCPGDEICTLLTGKISLIDENGRNHDYKAGDTFYMRKGEVATWTVKETVRKIFHIHDPDAEELAHKAA